MKLLKLEENTLLFYERMEDNDNTAELEQVVKFLERHVASLWQDNERLKQRITELEEALRDNIDLKTLIRKPNDERCTFQSIKVQTKAKEPIEVVQDVTGLTYEEVKSCSTVVKIERPEPDLPY